MEGDLVWAVQTSYDRGSIARFSTKGALSTGAEGVA